MVSIQNGLLSWWAFHIYISLQGTPKKNGGMNRHCDQGHWGLKKSMVWYSTWPICWAAHHVPLLQGHYPRVSHLCALIGKAARKQITRAHTVQPIEFFGTQSEALQSEALHVSCAKRSLFNWQNEVSFPTCAHLKSPSSQHLLADIALPWTKFSGQIEKKAWEK